MSQIAESTIPVGLHLIGSAITDAFEKTMVSRWLKEYEAHNAKKARRQKILAALAEGYDTVTEIAAHTEISQASVRRNLDQFVLQKRVRVLKTKNPNNRIELRYELS